MNISATNWPITMKFYQKHHWDEGKAAFGFGPDQIITLVSMATKSSHRIIMEKTVSPLFMPPNFEKVGSILVWACPCMCVCVRPFKKNSS